MRPIDRIYANRFGYVSVQLCVGVQFLTVIVDRKGQTRGYVDTMSTERPQLDPRNTRTPASTVPLVLRILAMILRALFLAALIIIIARVSSPQSETIWAVYETPEDLIRLALGFTACVWLVIHIFMLPKDAEGYRTWLYFGPVGVPLVWVIAVAKW
jgi:hypothetical protein